VISTLEVTHQVDADRPGERKPSRQYRFHRDRRPPRRHATHDLTCAQPLLQTADPRALIGEREFAMDKMAATIEEAVEGAFEGDALAILISLYKNPAKPDNLRMDAAKVAIRYERTALAPVEPAPQRDFISLAEIFPNTLSLRVGFETHVDRAMRRTSSMTDAA
jgi:hypothetical protein